MSNTDIESLSKYFRVAFTSRMAQGPQSKFVSDQNPGGVLSAMADAVAAVGSGLAVELDKQFMKSAKEQFFSSFNHTKLKPRAAHGKLIVESKTPFLIPSGSDIADSQGSIVAEVTRPSQVYGFIKFNFNFYSLDKLELKRGTKIVNTTGEEIGIVDKNKVIQDVNNGGLLFLKFNSENLEKEFLIPKGEKIFLGQTVVGETTETTPVYKSSSSLIEVEVPFQLNLTSYLKSKEDWIGHADISENTLNIQNLDVVPQAITHDKIQARFNRISVVGRTPTKNKLSELTVGGLRVVQETDKVIPIVKEESLFLDASSISDEGLHTKSIIPIIAKESGANVVFQKNSLSLSQFPQGVDGSQVNFENDKIENGRDLESDAMQMLRFSKTLEALKSGTEEYIQDFIKDIVFPSVSSPKEWVKECYIEPWTRNPSTQNGVLKIYLKTNQIYIDDNQIIRSLTPEFAEFIDKQVRGEVKLNEKGIPLYQDGVLTTGLVPEINSMAGEKIKISLKIKTNIEFNSARSILNDKFIEFIDSKVSGTSLFSSELEGLVRGLSFIDTFEFDEINSKDIQISPKNFIYLESIYIRDSTSKPSWTDEKLNRFREEYDYLSIINRYGLDDDSFDNNGPIANLVGADFENEGNLIQGIYDALNLKNTRFAYEDKIKFVKVAIENSVMLTLDSIYSVLLEYSGNDSVTEEKVEFENKLKTLAGISFSSWESFIGAVSELIGNSGTQKLIPYLNKYVIWSD